MSARAILFGELLVFVSLSKVFTLGEYDYPYKDKLDYDVPESVSHNISHPLWNQPIEETHITSTNVPNILTIDNSLAQVVQRVESTPNPNDLAKMWMRDYINKTHMKLDKERTKPNKQTPGHDYGPNINRQGPRAYATNPHMNAQMPAMYLNENGPNWDRPRTNMDNPGSVMLSPIANSNNPGPYMHRPDYGTDTVKNIPGPYMNSPRPNVNRPGQNMNRPVQTMNGPWPNVNGPGLNMNRPGQSMNRPNMYGKMNAAGQYMNSQGQYMNRQQANPNQGYSYQWQGWGNMSPQSPYKVQPSLFPAQSYYGKYPPVGVWNQGVNYYNSLDPNKYVRQNQGVSQNNAPNKVINPQDQLENLQNPVTDSQNFAENPSQYVNNSQNQMENAQNQVTNSQNQMENAQNQVTNSQNQVENAQNQVTNSQNQMKNAQNQVTISQNRMDHLQNQVTNPNQVTNSQNFEVNPSHQATNSQNQVENSQSQVTNTNQVTTNPKNQQNQVETQVPPIQQEMNANKQPVNESNINMQMDVNIQNQNVSKQEPTQNEVPNQPTQQPKPSQISNMEADIYDSIPGWYSVIPANEEEGASATFGSVPGLITEGDVGTEPDVAEHHADDALADLAVPTKLELYQPDEFVKEVEKFRLEHQLGYFSAFSIYLCEISSNMDSTDLREIFVGLKEVIDEKTKSGAFKHLGYPAGMMLPNAVQIMLSWDTDRLKSEILKGAELIRVKSLSPEVQNIYTQIDSLYTMTEGAELIKALYLVKVYPDKKQTTTFIARSLIQAILAPFTRLQGTPVQTKLMTDINTQLTKRLMARKSWEAVTNKRFKTTKSMHTITKERKKNDPSSKNKHSNGRHIRNDNNNADDNFQRESKQTYYTFTTERINKDDILETKQKYTLSDKRKKKDKYFDMKQIGTNNKERYEKVDDSFLNKPKKGRTWKRKDIRDENYFQSKQETVKDNSLELWNSNIQETSVQSDVNDYTKESDESKKADNFHYNNIRDELDSEDTFTKETKEIKEDKSFLMNLKDYDIKTSTKTTDFVKINIDIFQEDPNDAIAEEQNEILKVNSYFTKAKGDEEAHSKKSRSDNIFRNRENTSYYKINARNLKDTKIYKNTKPIKNRLKRNNNLKRKINKKEITIDKDRSNKRKGILYKLNFDNDEHFKENIEKQETDKSWTNTDEQILMEKLMEASRVKVIQNAQNQKTRSLKKKRNDVDKNSGIERRMNTLAIKRKNFEGVHENTLKNKILHIISDMENIVNILNSMESR